MKVLVLGGLDRSLLNFRGSLVRAMVLAGHRVVGAAPAENAEVPAGLEKLGAGFVPVPLARAGFNPLADMRSLFQLRALYRQQRPDVAVSYTIKPVVFGSLAAAWAGVPQVFALITGLGAAFHTAGAKGRVLRWVAVQLYRKALSHCVKVFVQNKDIAEMFVCERIVEADKLVIVPGSGVDVEHFAFQPLPDSPPTFLYMGRLLRDKGIAEFVAAARLVKAKRADTKFILMGDIDSNPASFSRLEIKAWQREGVVEHFGFQLDVRDRLGACTAYVLPSYHEGMPRSVLEAMAMGRPIITTDTIGCRDTIFDATVIDPASPTVKRGRNGYLVPVRSVQPLAVAMESLAADRQTSALMGRESRRIAESVFDVRRVNERMLREMGLSDGSSGGVGTTAP